MAVLTLLFLCLLQLRILLQQKVMRMDRVRGWGSKGGEVAVGVRVVSDGVVAVVVAAWEWGWGIVCGGNDCVMSVVVVKGNWGRRKKGGAKRNFAPRFVFE